MAAVADCRKSPLGDTPPLYTTAGLLFRLAYAAEYVGWLFALACTASDADVPALRHDGTAPPSAGLDHFGSDAQNAECHGSVRGNGGGRMLHFASRYASTWATSAGDKYRS